MVPSLLITTAVLYILVPRTSCNGNTTFIFHFLANALHATGGGEGRGQKRKQMTGETRIKCECWRETMH